MWFTTTLVDCVRAFWCKIDIEDDVLVVTLSTTKWGLQGLLCVCV